MPFDMQMDFLHLDLFGLKKISNIPRMNAEIEPTTNEQNKLGFKISFKSEINSPLANSNA